MARASTPNGCWRVKRTSASRADTSGCGGSRIAWPCWVARSRSTAPPGAARRSPSPCRWSDKPTVIRVLLADDHAIVLEGLRALLDGEPDIKVAAWTTDGTEVLKLVQQHKPDVVVLDLELTSVKCTAVNSCSRRRRGAGSKAERRAPPAI